MLAALGLVLVIALLIAVVSVSRWTYTELRTPANGTSASREAIPGPAVIGPATPAPAAPARDQGATSRSGTPATSIGPGGPPRGSERGPSLAIPVDGVTPVELYPSFADARGGRLHEAIDIMAPRGTPVYAATDGRIAKLFTSDAGGLTIYQFDHAETLACYYAHLDRYEPGLKEGAEVRRGDRIGYVGSTGNANADAPHLHFAVFVLGPDKRWWEGRPIDPYPLLRGESR